MSKLNIITKENKYERLSVRLSSEEKKMLNALSKKYRTSMSEVVTALIKTHHDEISKLTSDISVGNV